MAPAAADQVTLRRDPATGVESLSARFSGHAYDVHSHDAYAIGVTLDGVQRFRCRGGRRDSPAGGVVLIEPGEAHDGEAGVEHGFAYLMLYVPVAALNGRLGRSGPAELGFPANLAGDERLARRVVEAFDAFHRPELRMARDAALDGLAEALDASGALRARPRAQAPEMARRVREVLHERLDEDLGLDELAEIAGADRFRLSRAFTAAYGAPPHRYLVQLRLAAARRRLARGEAPALVAAETGFADQSHMGRWFRRCFGYTPGAYAAACTDVPYAGTPRGH